MPNKMLIDAAHPEETRVVVLRGNRVEEFDFESANRKQLRGNIYLAKVTRVEPSLQAAFVDYGGNRHGFLAFSEIHPDYYQIPVADRQALIEEEERAARAAEAEADNRAGRRAPRDRSADRRDEMVRSEPIAEPHDVADVAGNEIAAMAAGCETMIPAAGSAQSAVLETGRDVKELAPARHTPEAIGSEAGFEPAEQVPVPELPGAHDSAALASGEQRCRFAAERGPGSTRADLECERTVYRV